jgi:signal transduction histidine kinase
MKKTSLVRHMIVGVLVAELLCAVVLSGLAVTHEMHSRQRAFDIMLRGRADSVLGAIRDAEDPDDNAVLDPNELQLPKHDLYEVLDPSGRVLGGSPGLNSATHQALSMPPKDDYFGFRSGDARYRGIRLHGLRVIDRDDNGGIRRPVLIIYAAPTLFLWHEVLEAVRFYVIGGIALLAITAVALAWFLRRRLAPLEELAAIAAGVTPQSWDFLPPDRVLRTTELAPIAESIQHLLDGLRAAFERQRQLTGDAAHELKTSIAVLKSSVQLLSLSPRTAHEYEAGLEGLLLDTERTESLASRMLSLARLEEAPAESDETSDLSYAAVLVLDRLRPLAELRRIELASALDPAPVRVAADHAEVLCSNLVMNALQHTADGGHIAVRAGTRGGEVELRVIDTGEGIPEAALPHVFERFYRADTSRSRRSGGAGLGLSICKAIVERVNGSIKVRSTVGVGTEVMVTLPQAKDSVATETAAAKPAQANLAQDYFDGKV